MIVWIAQTPFDIPFFFWTNKRLDIVDIFNSNANFLAAMYMFALYCCCAGWIGNNANIGRWITMMYRFVVSLTFSSIILHMGGENEFKDLAIYALLCLTLVMPLMLSMLNFFIITNKWDRDALTLDRNVMNLAAGGGLNEMEDLKLFGMNIDNMTHDGLFIACKNGDINALRSFANMGTDFGVTNDDGDTPLIVATRNNKTKAVEFMLSQNQKPPKSLCNINQPNTKTGQTALIISAIYQNEEENGREGIVLRAQV